MPFDLHRYIIGQKGSGIRKMMDEFEVTQLRGSFLWGADAELESSPTSRPPCPEPTGVSLADVTGQRSRLARCQWGPSGRVPSRGPPRTRRCPRPPQVNIHVPAPELQSDIVAITGLAANLGRAKAGLLERVRELQAEQEDRVSAGRAGVAALKGGWGYAQATPSCGQHAETFPQRRCEAAWPPLSYLAATTSGLPVRQPFL